MSACWFFCKFKSLLDMINSIFDSLIDLLQSPNLLLHIGRVVSDPLRSIFGRDHLNTILIIIIRKLN